MTERIIIELPLPPDCLHPNSRPHWRAKAAATKKARAEACLVARTQRPAKPFKSACYRLYFRLPRKRDYDGLLSWTKAYADGLADGGILHDDSDFRPEGIERISGKKQTGGRYGVTFVIWEASPISPAGMKGSLKF